MEGAKIIDEVDVHPISLILLKFFSLILVPLIWGSHRVNWAGKFQNDTVITIGVERNSIGSPAVKGGNVLRCQGDILPGVKCDDILDQTPNTGKQT